MFSVKLCVFSGENHAVKSYFQTSMHKLKCRKVLSVLPALEVAATKVTIPSTAITLGLGLSSNLEINSLHISLVQCRWNLISSSHSINSTEKVWGLTQENSLSSEIGLADSFSYSAWIIKNTKWQDVYLLWILSPLWFLIAAFRFCYFFSVFVCDYFLCFLFMFMF